jgi:hypothetical protein
MPVDAELWMALWIKAEEAKAEAPLLAQSCPRHAVIAWP